MLWNMYYGIRDYSLMKFLLYQILFASSHQPQLNVTLHDFYRKLALINITLYFNVLKCPYVKNSFWILSTMYCSHNMSFSHVTGSRQHFTLKSQWILVIFGINFKIKRSRFSLVCSTYVQFCTKSIVLYF